MALSRTDIKNNNAERLIEFLSTQERPVPIITVADGINLPPHSARRLLNELADDFKIEVTVGLGRGGGYEYALPNIDFIPSLWHGRASRNVDLVTLAQSCNDLNKSPVIASNFTKIASAQLLLAVIDKVPASGIVDIREEIYNNIQVLENITKMLKQLLNHKKIWTNQVDFSSLAPFSGGGVLEKRFVDDVEKLISSAELEEIRLSYSSLTDVLNLLTEGK
jgi:hypothetical protein